jgi:ATP-dependent DNA helicase DinG
VRRTARAAAEAIAALEAPLQSLSRQLEAVLDDEADVLNANGRARLEGALRALDRRARMQLPAWRSMLDAIDENAEDDPDFVDWFDATFLYGRVVDAGCRRHWVDPTEPLTAAVIAPAHGVLITSATLADSTLVDPFALAEMRTGAQDAEAGLPFRLWRQCAGVRRHRCRTRRSATDRRRYAGALFGRQRRGARRIHGHSPTTGCS